jgi:hypothetical protein
MEAFDSRWTIRDRLLATLRGDKPDRPPFIDRLEIWYNCHIMAGTMPQKLQGLSLTDLHRTVGMGQQKFAVPYALRLSGVEVISTFQGETVYRETSPVVEFFPTMADLAVRDRPGITSIRLITPVGSLRVQHEILPAMVRDGTDVYVKEHLIKDEEDYRVVEYIIERAEYVPQYEEVYREEQQMGDIGYVVPLLHRIPFQQVLLEYLGEIPLFYALYDSPELVQRLLAVLDQQLTHFLHSLADFGGIYVEFPDNLHGLMTNPKLFEAYCLPAYQQYSDILHAQGKVVGTHTDGDVKPLLGLLAESGLDVCESFSPVPLSTCTLDEAWNAWQNGPIVWGGIPSPILEERTSESEFKDHIDHLLENLGAHPTILGVGDMVLGNNLIERVRYIAEQVEALAAA